MDVAQVGAAVTAIATAATTVSGSISCAGANCLVLALAYSDTAPDANPATITFNSVSLGAAVAAASSGGSAFGRIRLYVMVNPPAGPFTFAATFATSQDEIQLSAQAFARVNVGAPTGVAATANGTTAAPSVVVAAAVGDLVIDCVYIIDTGGAGPTLAVGAGQAQIANFTSSATVVREGVSSEPGAASVTMSWTTNGVHDEFGIVAIALKAAPGTLSLLGAG